ncbi:L,D-transpeptidase [Paenibacillus protaetiae]|nr:L,D-transpeptidase [Paenibacillus protaetiae]
MEDREHIYYLKSFVKRHPGNRMAWYLLGKQYEEQGKLSKANYCYLEAGEVYEAFERKMHPLVAVEQELEQLQKWKERGRQRRFRLKSVVLALLLLLLSGLQASPVERDKRPQAAAVHTAAESALQQQAPPAVVFTKRAEKKPLGAALELAAAESGRAGTVLAAQMEEDGAWRLWQGRTKLLLSTQKEKPDGQWEVAMYDPASCNCKPADSAPMVKVLKHWSAEQELRWVLSSAIIAYFHQQGSMPASLSDLIGSYPNNYIAGEKEGMAAMFAPLMQQLAVDQNVKALAAGVQQQPAPGSGSGIVPADKQWRTELQIVVDPAKHRLAVVSGDIMVRSYPVGLGGNKTPEGTFTITEKVKNPNGTDKGPYGSRGMELSDGPYAIHGTDEPDSIGEDESLGCIRMERADLEELYDLVPLGTKVTIQKGLMPPKPAPAPETRFRLKPVQDETNPHHKYSWLG